MIVSCFDRSAIMVRPWAEAGHLCFCVDIAHEPGITGGPPMTPFLRKKPKVKTIEERVADLEAKVEALEDKANGGKG